MAIFLLVIEMSKEDDIALERVPYIYYSIWFKKNEVQALIDSDNEVNAMTPAYTTKQSLKLHHTNIGAQKIDGFTLKTFGMVLANFQIEDKLGKTRFFQETFLLIDINVEVVLSMSFLTLSNIDI